MDLGLTATAKCLILCDKAAVHSTQAFEEARRQWELENNTILISGSTSDRVCIPGGWGAAGGPNDGWHQHWHGLRRNYMKIAAGLGGTMRSRKILEDMGIAMDGNQRLTSLS